MDAPIYKQFALARTAICLLFSALLLGFAGIAAAQTDQLYTVEGVQVDVTDKNAVKAREKAMEEAQVKAYQMLAERILSPAELTTFKMPDANTVSLLVQDIEVTNEQLSRVRYKGTFTVRFRPNAMKSNIAAQTKPQVPVQPGTSQKPVLVLPFFHGMGQQMLWHGSNPWMNAWRAIPTDRSMMQPTVLPVGDAADIAKIGDYDFGRYDPMRVQEMASRYGANDVVILLASPDSYQRLVVTIYKHGFQGAQQVQKVTFDRLPQELDSALYARAAAKVREMLIQNRNASAQPPQRNAYPTAPAPQQPPLAAPMPYTRQALGPVSEYFAMARFANVQEWVRLKTALERTPGVQSMLVRALRSREATIDLRFAGNVNQLQSSLQSAGIAMRAGGAGAPLEIYMNTVGSSPYGYRQ